MLDLAITWLPIVGPVLFGFGISVWFGTENKTTAIWLCFAGVVMLAAGLALHFQKIVLESEAKPAAPSTAEIAQARAYVIVDASEIRNFGTALPLEGWLMLKNTGNTPAFNLERSSKLMMTPFPAAAFPDLEWGGSKSDLGPRGEVMFGPVPLPRALTAEENAAVIAGRSALYLFGEIRYQDAFKQSRTTKFRVRYRGNGTAPAIGAVLATTHDPEGNQTD